jgi:hypothetical protein
LPEPPPIATCPTESLEWCDGGGFDSSPLLGPQQREDEADAKAAQLCIERHHAAVRCLRRLKAAGVFEAGGGGR